MWDCEFCPFVSKSTYKVFDAMQIADYDRMRYTPYDKYIEGMVTDFFAHMPQTVLWNNSNGVYYTRYDLLQDCLLEYCRKKYPWEKPIYMEENTGRVVLVANNGTYEKYIKDYK